MRAWIAEAVSELHRRQFAHLSSLKTLLAGAKQAEHASVRGKFACTKRSRDEASVSRTGGWLSR